MDYLVGAATFTKFENYELSVFTDAEEVSGQDIVFILGYTKILPLSWLAQNKLNLVVHESDLPYGRGFAPVQWQILADQDVLTVSLVEAAAEVDAGDIILKQCLIFDGTELYEEIRAKQAEATILIITRFLEIYPGFERLPQTGAASFYSRRRPADSELDPHCTIADQFNLLRICNNEDWPAFFNYRGQKYIVKIEKACNSMINAARGGGC
jgi:methionyl-tRNA formyltransferase